jgi:cysteine synthase A
MRANDALRARLHDLETAMRITPTIPLDEPRMRLFAKLEYCGLVGSIKDRAALWILKSAILRGEIGPDTTIVESSSGNFAIATASFARMLGLRFVPVIDPNISALNEAILRSLCAQVVKVDQRDDTGGYLKTRIARVNEICASARSAFWTNQYANTDGMMGHYHMTGGEIVAALPELDYAFIGVSSGGTIAGISQRLKERSQRTKIIAVDAEGSVIFGGSPKKRRIPGLGSSIVPGLVAEACIDDVVVIPESDTIEGCRDLLRRHRLFAGGSSGTTYAAIRRYLAKVRGHGTPSVLFLCADRGTAYIDTIYNDEWVAQLREAS